MPRPVEGADRPDGPHPSGLRFVRRWRIWFDGAGLVAVCLLAASVPWPEGWSTAGPFGLLLAWGLGALAGEAVGLIAGLRRPGPRDAPADAAPADGAVEIVAVGGVESEPNSVDARFRRFVSVASAPVDDPVQREAPLGRELPPLLGRLTILSIFVGRHGRSWGDAETARTLASLVKAAGWIEAQARRWGARANVAIGDVYFAADDPENEDVDLAVVSEGDGLGLFEAHSTERGMASASRAASALGFEGLGGLVDRITAGVPGDHVVWLVHPRAAGRSHAIDNRVTLLPGVSLAICYAEFADFPAPLRGSPSADSATLAHELMHLFGATDKYGMSLAEFPPGSVTPADIMRLEVPGLGRMRVDPGTAVELGWSIDGRPPTSRPETSDARRTR